MICQRCGYCCICLDATVINPASIRSDGSIDTDDPNAMIIKPAGQKCPHLTFHADRAVCIIHYLQCFNGTPCQQFEQFGSDDAPCILGCYLKSISAEIGLS